MNLSVYKRPLTLQERLRNDLHLHADRLLGQPITEEDSDSDANNITWHFDFMVNGTEGADAPVDGESGEEGRNSGGVPVYLGEPGLWKEWHRRVKAWKLSTSFPPSKQGANVLLLDEPTNDLDVETLRALEEALLAFPGSALVISHDRWFLDRIATHILAFEGNSQVVWFEGNYQDYESDRKHRVGEKDDQPHRIKYKPLVR